MTKQSMKIGMGSPSNVEVPLSAEEAHVHLHLGVQVTHAHLHILDNVNQRPFEDALLSRNVSISKKYNLRKIFYCRL